ncbi:glycogen/starch/alpha-glucan phosphorylase [Corynebacterium sp. TAE3-ERU12]|uniref:glycogen/starch/alpha-glucan phosphorylase n=1 Tax=Corynebacterium sp. TAE3-ERU12 TaxID=2849491 RepID=UPI001C4821E7|nr:glycogen/starch/alpha-glucan phosphorylase [Corynebacterium sp. TAE3-ERU12]
MTSFTDRLGSHVRAESGRTPQTATETEFWSGLSGVVVDELAENWERTNRAYAQTRRQHYFSAEFLMGRALLNNLLNLDRLDEAREAVASFGHDITDVLESEHDAALGNGGLGRLAACFLDSCATQDLPVNGYGILYRYGLFRQTFEDGFQDEHPDPWMEEGYPFVVRREESYRIVRFDDLVVRAVPYDMPITGYGTDNVNTLRLWNSEPMREFDYDAFNSQRFTDAIVERERVHDLCRVLYPNDSTYEGKVLRVRQQYFFVSASLQQMVDEYIAEHGDDLRDFHKYNCIQLNDTHPVLAIPELMRILLDEHHMSWEDAWEVTSKTFAYTNHTVLAEALETWEFSIFERLFRRVLEITQEIDRRFRIDLAERGVDHATIDYLAPISNGRIHMAWIACYTSFSINGVAALHTEIIKRETLKEWHDLWPERFNNKTNGVTPRRWLNQCNPRLRALLTRLCGSDEWVTDLDKLTELERFADDEDVLRELIDIKQANKAAFADWILDRQGVQVPTDAIYDAQIKRLHEYKRQLLNALYLLDLYFRMKENPELDVVPRVAIFGAKAAPGYFRAKAIIKFINEIAELVNNDPAVGDKLKVVFVENYNVSPAERIIPAADISEQISTAGKEASGTGNMKFMMNGALTLGTLDGANVEIHEAVGDENAYIFGAREEELPQLRANHNPFALYEQIPGLKRVLDTLTDGTFSDGGTGMFNDLKASLLSDDQWYVLGDFADYRDTRDRMAEDYRDEMAWARKCFINIIRSGRFSSDRTISDYANEVWKISPTAI